MVLSRAFPNILTEDVSGTRDFYVGLLGFKVSFESDWFVNLNTGGEPAYELGIWRRDHELIPRSFQQPPAGVVLSFVVDDVDAVHSAAVGRGIRVVAPPRNLFYGARQLLVVDPNGILVDVSTPVAMDEEFASSLVEEGGTVRQRP